MRVSNSSGDDEIMVELGNRIIQMRINLGYSQESLAEQAGIAKRTMERLENGMQVQSRSLIRVLRILGQLGNLDLLIPPVEVRPMEVLMNKKATRKRVSSPRKLSGPDKPWTWGDNV
jgi:transcriptional regulator with XRE-family HTH domain